MFTVLTIHEEKGRGLRAALRRRFPPPPQKEILGEGKARFIQVILHQGRREPDWEEVRALAGSGARCMVVPRGLSLPEGWGFRLFVPGGFYRMLCFNTAKALLKNSPVPLTNRMVGVIDQEGVYFQEIRELLSLCAGVKIYTQVPERYEEFSERVMDHLGAPLLFMEDLSQGEDCLFHLSLGPAQLEVSQRIQTPVLSSGETTLWGDGFLLDRWEAEQPSWIGESCPAGIDPTLLMAALWEHNQVEELGRAQAVAGWCRENHLDIRTLEQTLWERHLTRGRRRIFA